MLGTSSGSSPGYAACALCPRSCGAGRDRGKRGFCGEGAELRLASAGLHFGEEPPLVGTRGSGTIFVTGCGLGCPFCQNRQISREGMGRPVSRDEFVSICLALQDAGALNVNIVTGSHAIPALAEGLEAAKGAGLSIPVCWNSSAYESPQALAVIAPLVDIWLPDLKSLDSGVCAGIFNAPDYPEAAAGAILFMLASSPLRFAPDGESLLGGVIVRHLFLPGLIEGTAAVLDWLKAHAASRALISLMTQYTPMPGAPSQGGPPVFEDRFVSPREAQDLRDLVDAYGFEEVFFQELLPGSEWLPDFRRPQPFSSALARPLWHWSTGFIRA